jgi:hypothetical protein
MQVISAAFVVVRFFWFWKMGNKICAAGDTGKNPYSFFQETI